MSDYSKLKRLAEAATPGPWSTEANDLYWLENGYTKHLMETFDGSDICHDAEHPANLKFIAAANPAAMLALIGQNDYLELELSGVERAKQELAEKLGCADEPRWKWLLSGADDLTKERDQLKAELEHTGYDHDLLRKEHDLLKAENNSLRNDNKSLRGSCEAIGKLYKAVKRDRNAFRRECARLEAEVEVEALRKVRDKLAEDNRNLIEDPGSAL